MLYKSIIWSSNSNCRGKSDLCYVNIQLYASKYYYVSVMLHYECYVFEWCLCK